MRLLCVSIVLGLAISLSATHAEANDTVHVCNSSDKISLNIATANNYWVGGNELWKESGWYTVDPGNCENIRSVRPYHDVGYALLLRYKGKNYNPRVEFDWTDADFARRAKYNHQARMCIGTGVFSIAKKRAHQVGKDCWDNNSLRFSFFTAGSNRSDSWTMRIDPDSLINPSNLVRINGEFGVNNNPAFSSRSRIPSTESCEKGNATDCLNAANLAYKRGGKQDMRQARELYQKGCEGNIGRACGYYAQMLNQGQGGEINSVVARKLLTNACEGATSDGVLLGLSNADSRPFCAEVGEMFKIGEGGAKDEALYKKYAMRGCDSVTARRSTICKQLMREYKKSPWKVW